MYVCSKCNVAVNKEIIKEQSTCPQCDSSDLKEESAIEVGNIFSLGTRFSEALGLEFTDEKGKKQAATPARRAVESTHKSVAPKKPPSSQVEKPPAYESSRQGAQRQARIHRS